MLRHTANTRVWVLLAAPLLYVMEATIIAGDQCPYVGFPYTSDGASKRIIPVLSVQLCFGFVLSHGFVLTGQHNSPINEMPQSSGYFVFTATG